jgi:poly(3-hydroxybutyrate) depolymerase
MRFDLKATLLLVFAIGATAYGCSSDKNAADAGAAGSSSFGNAGTQASPTAGTSGGDGASGASGTAGAAANGGGALDDAGAANAGTGGTGGSNGGAGIGGWDGGGGACAGKPGSKRGKTMQTVMVGGIPRTFVLYAPMKLDPNQPVPVVVVAHGYTMSGAMMFDITQYDKIAEREGIVVAYPDGEGVNPWNCGAGICGLGATVNAVGDDQAFMEALLKLIEDDQCIDHPHVFITGFSMGGYFSNETACVNPKFRAAGPHSGGTHDLSSCKTGHKPMIIFHVKTDSLIIYSCGQDARDQWVKHNGCMSGAGDVVQVKGGSCEYAKGCPADGQVALCSFDLPSGAATSFSGHGWAGGSTAGMGASYAVPGVESASELGWAFFEKYAW